MISFVFDGYDAFAGAEARGEFTIERFPNQELTAKVMTDLKDQPCQIIGTIAPPDENLLSVSLLADTLRRDGAQNIIAYLPYLAYSRQDQNEPGTSRGIAWVGQQLLNAGIEKIITIDVHSQKAVSLCPIPITSLSPAPLFAETIRNHISLENLTVIAPDKGATQRASDIADELELQPPTIMIKQRIDGLAHTLPKVPTSRALIVDDILDTGHTLIACCQELQKQGVNEIYVTVTHGLFTGDAWQEVWELGVQQIFVGNTVLDKKIDDNRISHCNLSLLY